MKALGLCAAVLFASASAAWAAHGIEFVGQLNIVSVTPACTNANETAVNDIYSFRYNPPNLGGTNTDTAFSILAQGGAQNYDLASGTLIGTGWHSVQGVAVWRHGYWWNTSTMRITKQTPATLALTTTAVTVVGDITNYDDVTGCTVHFTGSGVYHS